MVDHGLPRRQLVVEARPDELDALVGDVAALLALAGCPVRLLEPDPPAARLAAPPAPPAPAEPSAVLGAGDLVLVPDTRVARRAGVDLGLTRIEFDLLSELLRQANRVLTKDALLRAVWHHEQVTVNAIEARVSRLRAKLERHGPRVIHTVRGVGYVLHVPTAGADGDAVVIELVADAATIPRARTGSAELISGVVPARNPAPA